MVINKLDKICPACSNKFSVLPCYADRVSCSKSCGLKIAWANGTRTPTFGKKISDETKKKISNTILRKLEKHQNWKGDKVGYTALHQWMYLRYGQPKTCENSNGKLLGFLCSNIGKQFDWANKHGSPYDRNRNSWFRLCRSCHIKYDR